MKRCSPLVGSLVLTLLLPACGGGDDGGKDSLEGDILFQNDGLEPGDDGYVPPDSDTLNPDGAQSDETAPDVYVEPGGPGNQEFAVNGYTLEDQKYPALAVSSEGKFLVAWQSGKVISSAPQDGSGWGVIVKRFHNNAASDEAEFVAPTTTQGNQTRPAVAFRNDEGFWVLWEAEGMVDGSLKDIAAKAFNDKLEVVTEEWRINQKVDSNQTQPIAFVNSRNDLTVIWQADGSLDGDAEGLYGQIYLGGSVKKGPEFMVNTFTADGQKDASMAAASTGAFVVAWTSEGQDNGIGNGVYANRYLDTGAATGEFLVNTELNGQQEKPDVGFFSDGRFVIVWQSYPGQDGDGSGVFGQIYSATGAKIGSEFQVNQITPGQQSTPRVAVLPNDTFVVVWQSCPNTESNLGGDGDDCGIVGRILSGGNAVTSDFVVNQTVKGVQEYPRIASLGDGAFVVVWSSIGQDLESEPKGYGIFGRRFPAGFKP